MAEFSKGDRVRVVKGEEHEESQSVGEVAEVHPGPAYGLLIDGMEDQGIHEWYVGDELEPESLTAAAFHRRGHHIQGAHGRRVHLATDSSHTSGGMIALMPTAADAKRLAFPGGEPAAELHCTLLFLGDDGDAWPEDARDALEEAARQAAVELEPVQAKIFGVAHWNGNSDKPSWVWSVGDAPGQEPEGSRLEEVRAAVGDILGMATAMTEGDMPEIPEQHSPWAAHICAAYSGDLTVVRALEKRLGPVTFDRIRLSFGDDDRDIPLGSGALTASGFRREPLPHEQHCDFAEQNRQWEGAVQTTSVRLTAELADWRKQIREQITAGADTPEELARLTVETREAADILGEAMYALAQRAGDALVREAQRQGVEIAEWSLPDDTVTAAVGGQRLLRSVAQMSADLLATSLVQKAKRVVTGLFTQQASPATIATEVDRALQEDQESLVRSQVGTAMSTAQTAGRQAVLEAAPPATYYASEILDKNTCGPCRAVDGERFSSLEIAVKAYPVMGYKDCVGPRYGNSCRGFIVAEWRPEETEPVTAAGGARPFHGKKGDPGYELLHGDGKVTPKSFMTEEQATLLRDDLDNARSYGFVSREYNPSADPGSYDYDPDEAELSEGQVNFVEWEGPAVSGAPAVREAESRTSATLRPGTQMIGEGSVPWQKVPNHSECGDGQWAVVKVSDGSVAGCHDSEAEADEQLAALYASEGDNSVTTEALRRGKPSQGTKKDKRLKENQYAEEGHFGSSNSVSKEPWNGAASNFSDEQWKNATAACEPGEGTPKSNCFLPHHNPGGALNRSGLGAAAGRANQLDGRNPQAVARAKAHLRGHYRALGEPIPENLRATPSELSEFGVEEGYEMHTWRKDECPPGMEPDGSGNCVEMMASRSESLETEPSATAPWRGPLTVEGIETGDGREFDPGALTWADLPLPLRWNIEDSHGGEPRTKAVNVGRIDKIWREDSGLIMGEGVLDLSDEQGQKAYSKIQGKFLRGVSVDVDSIKDADMELVWPDHDPDGEGEPDPFAQLFASPEKVVFHKGRIRAATLVDIPAFAEAYIALLDGEGAVVAGGEPIGALRATHFVRAHTAGVQPPAAPPADWFVNPDLSVPTGITVTPEGRVYGHAALWGTCHIGQAGMCVTPPHEDFHPYFMTGSVACADGAVASVGQITVGTGHAPLSYNHRAASEHYDNTGWAVADVTVGNDAHGIWVAGAIRRGADPDRVHELRAAGQVSGDWRRIGGQLRLVGLLAVNVPGFPVPKLASKYTGGQQLALVAAGIPDLHEQLTEEDLDQWAYSRIMSKLNQRVHGKG